MTAVFVLKWSISFVKLRPQYLCLNGPFHFHVCSISVEMARFIIYLLHYHCDICVNMVRFILDEVHGPRYLCVGAKSYLEWLSSTLLFKSRVDHLTMQCYRNAIGQRL